MDRNDKDRRYEKLHEEMVSYTKWLHKRNKFRVKIGCAMFVILPVVLAFIRWFTDSDKVVFMLIWVFCMIALAIYLVGVEYLDYSIQKTLKKLSGTEVEFDSLLPFAKIVKKVRSNVRNEKGGDDE